uniref:Uncharacterized protein n=1 Tax=Arundo donax TaxID=35708 RepID=A0A0A9GDG6_ARUDO
MGAFLKEVLGNTTQNQRIYFHTIVIMMRKKVMRSIQFRMTLLCLDRMLLLVLLRWEYFHESAFFWRWTQLLP